MAIFLEPIPSLSEFSFHLYKFKGIDKQIPGAENEPCQGNGYECMYYEARDVPNIHRNRSEINYRIVIGNG